MKITYRFTVRGKRQLLLAPCSFTTEAPPMNFDVPVLVDDNVIHCIDRTAFDPIAGEMILHVRDYHLKDEEEFYAVVSRLAQRGWLFGDVVGGE